VTLEPFGKTPDGGNVEAVTLENGNGVRMRVMTYGATVISLLVPDRSGQARDVVLGHDHLSGYLLASPYFGAVIGRYANRIARGRFTLGGVEYRLATNNGPNHLHGGVRGFDKVIWTVGEVEAGRKLVLRYVSPDGEEGYPGTLTATVSYELGERNEITIDYEAVTDRPTPVNLSQHSYFNLSGSDDILDHELTIAADRFTPVAAGLIPTGSLDAVAGTPLDFRTARRIGERINDRHPQLVLAGGYDHNYVLSRPGDVLAAAARLRDPGGGLTLEVRTTEPGIQFYSGNFLDGSITGKGGAVYRRHGGLCLETQHFPDSPNRPSFPSTILEPGRTYRSRTVWSLSA